MQQIFKNESIAGLWRGITPTLMGVIPARAIYFGAYNKFKETFAHRDMNGRMYNFLAAAGAGSFSATLVCPIWVVKTRVQLLPAHSTGELMKHVTFSSASSSYASTRPNILTLGLTTARPLSTIATKPSTIPLSSVRRVAWEMYCKEGPRAFFRGLSASYWGISESAIQFALYEESKEWIEEPNAMKYFIAAGASKLLAAAMTYPHEVVRTRMRDQRGPIGSKDLKYRTMFQSIRTIFREEGTRGLYGGMPAHLMRVVPNAAIMFLVVELLTKKDSDDS
jgi:solute carrier family 25 protein 33/36